MEIDSKTVTDEEKTYNYHFEHSPPSFKVCAEGAEKIFKVIAKHESFAPKARRDFSYKKSKPKRRSESSNPVFKTV